MSTPRTAFASAVPASSRSPREQRAAPRVAVELPVALHLAGLPAPLAARARDIGVGGMAVTTRAPFALGEVRRAVLSLPDGPLDLRAQGRWQRPSPGEGVLLSGLVFVEPDARAVERLWDAVQTAGKTLAHLLVDGSDLAPLGIEGALALAHATRRRSVRAGEWVYRQGSQAPGEDSIFVVEGGEVVLQVRVRNAREVPIARLGPGRLFGGLTLLADEPAGESAVAARDARLLEIDRSAFEGLHTAQPWLAWQLAARVLAAHAQHAHALLARASEGA